MWLGKAINFVQKLKSVDNESTYGHAGIILSPQGETFESLWTIRKNHLDEYNGCKVLIGRAIWPSQDDQNKAIAKVISDHEGMRYPWWRLPLHMIGLAKFISVGIFPVCSELTVKKEIESGVTAWGSRWAGKNPDHVADAIRRWDAYEPIFEGIWNT
jgi:hypothetical protein